MFLQHPRDLERTVYKTRPDINYLLLAEMNRDGQRMQLLDDPISGIRLDEAGGT